MLLSFLNRRNRHTDMTHSFETAFLRSVNASGHDESLILQARK